jgi:aconitate hydratase
MGVLPLEFKEGVGARSLGLTGEETFDILGMEGLAPGGELTVIAKGGDGNQREFPVIVRLNSQVEVDYWLRGGILRRFIMDMMGETG